VGHGVVRPGLVWALIAGLLAAGCSALPDQRPGNLEVRVWDHREAIEDFRELRLRELAFARSNGVCVKCYVSCIKKNVTLDT
jgi:hypothetical protein